MAEYFAAYFSGRAAARLDEPPLTGEMVLGNPDFHQNLIVTFWTLYSVP